MVHITLLLFFSAVLQTQCAREPLISSFPRNKHPPKIGPSQVVFGGGDANDGQFPFLLYVQYWMISSGVIGSCTASLVSESFVLLAAHCFDDDVSPRGQNVLMVAGRANLAKYKEVRSKINWDDDIDEKALDVQERRGVEITIKNYNNRKFTHDIAVVKANRPFILTQKVNPIPISNTPLRSKTSCTISGWGYTEGNELSYRLVYAQNIIAKSTLEGCIYKNSGPFLCLEKSKAGICQGDSGSPLVCDGKVWGVASHVLGDVSNPQCGYDFEEFYAELYPDLAWINEKIGADSPINKSPKPPNAGGGALNIRPIFANLGLFLVILCFM